MLQALHLQVRVAQHLLLLRGVLRRQELQLDDLELFVFVFGRRGDGDGQGFGGEDVVEVELGGGLEGERGGRGEFVLESADEIGVELLQSLSGDSCGVALHVHSGEEIHYICLYLLLQNVVFLRTGWVVADLVGQLNQVGTAHEIHYLQLLLLRNLPLLLPYECQQDSESIFQSTLDLPHLLQYLLLFFLQFFLALIITFADIIMFFLPMLLPESACSHHLPELHVPPLPLLQFLLLPLHPCLYFVNVPPQHFPAIGLKHPLRVFSLGLGQSVPLLLQLLPLQFQLGAGILLDGQIPVLTLLAEEVGGSGAAESAFHFNIIRREGGEAVENTLQSIIKCEISVSCAEARCRRRSSTANCDCSRRLSGRSATPGSTTTTASSTSSTRIRRKTTNTPERTPRGSTESSSGSGTGWPRRSPGKGIVSTLRNSRTNSSFISRYSINRQDSADNATGISSASRRRTTPSPAPRLSLRSSTLSRMRSFSSPTSRRNSSALTTRMHPRPSPSSSSYVQSWSFPFSPFQAAQSQLILDFSPTTTLLSASSSLSRTHIPTPLPPSLHLSPTTSKSHRIGLSQKRKILLISFQLSSPPSYSHFRTSEGTSLPLKRRAGRRQPQIVLNQDSSALKTPEFLVMHTAKTSPNSPSPTHPDSPELQSSYKILAKEWQRVEISSCFLGSS